ncbi:ATP-binding cassette domain-containing protein [bacterium]|nr:ATP-binding cassette domain-containing protein [bacterium]
MESAIRVENLTKQFGRFTAVNHINFSVNRGEIMGFLGPNGAGKTTTLKMITGLLKITSGDIWIKEYDVKKDLKRIKSFIGYMSQKFSLYPLLNSYENMEFFAGVSGLPAGEIQKKKSQISQTIPEKILKQKVMDIPPGIKQRVALFTCLMPDPEILFLDEPTSGVDPEMRRDFWMNIYELKKEGKTILVTTHNLDEAEYADRVLIIHKGNIALQGEPLNLLDAYQAPSMENLFKQAIDSHETN